MKLVVLLIVILAVIWFARRGSRRVAGSGRERAPLPPHEDMIACGQCGLHLPRSEALPGRGGSFCCEAHRAEFEREHG